MNMYLGTYMFWNNNKINIISYNNNNNNNNNQRRPGETCCLSDPSERWSALASVKYSSKKAKIDNTLKNIKCRLCGNRDKQLLTL